MNTLPITGVFQEHFCFKLKNYALIVTTSFTTIFPKKAVMLYTMFSFPLDEDFF